MGPRPPQAPGPLAKRGSRRHRRQPPRPRTAGARQADRPTLDRAQCRPSGGPRYLPPRKAMNELLVHLAGEPAGRLVLKQNGNMQFRYDGGYSGVPISRAMPLQEEAHPHATCRAVFGGLLLEGEGREAVARNLGISAGNDYALLKELGGDCAGAITLVPPDTELPTEPRLRPLSAGELDETIRDLPLRPLAADPQAGTRLSLAGAQPKLPVVVEDDEIAL